MKKSIFLLTNCRVCKSNTLEKVLSFGPTPLANAFLNSSQINEPEYYYPLDVVFCRSCSFLQLSHVVDPKLLFGDYVYYSSTSAVFIKHFEDFADSVSRDYALSGTSLVIDIGSNDGILLKPFKKLNIKVLGIEPAEHIAVIANKEGINTLPNYFNVKLAKKIKDKYGQAKIVTATNVFAHIHDLDEVIEGLKVLLEKKGVFIMEAPYLIDFIKNNYFDLVYHEHLSYWSVRSLITLFKRFDMTIIDVQKVPVHGGSIRVFVSRQDEYKVQKSVGKFLKIEDKYKLADINTYYSYASKVQKNKIKLLTTLADIKSKNKSIAGYGAPAKGNTLLNFFSIGTETLDFIADDSKPKQGLYTPGKHIPVVQQQTVLQKMPDYLLILAWNFANSIMINNSDYKRKGGKFIVPVPTPKIL